MARDFTMEAYGDLLDAASGAGYEFLTVRDYVAAECLPERFVILRHDVDRKPGNAVAMARLEAERGVASTYYFRTVAKTLRPSLIREVADLGHEVGYHYEDVDRADGDLALARDRFAEHLARVRAVSPVETVCMHGNPLSRHDNRALFAEGPATLAEFDLLGEAYLSVDFADVVYFSDTGRTWRDGDLKVKDTTGTEADKPVEVGTTHELAAMLEGRGVDRACLLVHPNRWARTRPELVVEAAKDLAVNVVKRGLDLSGRFGSDPTAIGRGDAERTAADGPGTGGDPTGEGAARDGAGRSGPAAGGESATGDPPRGGDPATGEGSGVGGGDRP